MVVLISAVVLECPVQIVCSEGTASKTIADKHHAKHFNERTCNGFETSLLRSPKMINAFLVASIGLCAFAQSVIAPSITADWCESE